MKYDCKEALLTDIRNEHDALQQWLRQVPTARWREPGVWGDEWTVADLVAHLAAWQRLFLTWHEDGDKGVKVEMPAPGYKWNETPRLNRAIRESHQRRSVSAIKRDFNSGYRRILELAERLSPGQLLDAGHFAWTGRNPLVTYLSANTASHYRFATKIILRWMRKTTEGEFRGARSA